MNVKYIYILFVCTIYMCIYCTLLVRAAVMAVCIFDISCFSHFSFNSYLLILFFRFIFSALCRLVRSIVHSTCPIVLVTLPFSLSFFMIAPTITTRAIKWWSERRSLAQIRTVADWNSRAVQKIRKNGLSNGMKLLRVHVPACYGLCSLFCCYPDK